MFNWESIQLLNSNNKIHIYIYLWYAIYIWIRDQQWAFKTMNRFESYSEFLIFIRIHIYFNIKEPLPLIFKVWSTHQRSAMSIQKDEYARIILITSDTHMHSYILILISGYLLYSYSNSEVLITFILNNTYYVW